MFLLLSLAGILLAFGGPVSSAQGALDQAAELKSSENLINQIIRYQKQLEREAKRREQAEYFKGSNIDLRGDTDRNGIVEKPLQQEIEDPLQEDLALQVDENRKENDEPTTTTEVVYSHPANAGALSAGEEEAAHQPNTRRDNKIFLLVIIGGCSVAGLIGVIMAGVCWYKLHTRVKAASDVEYPAYGVTGPTKERLPSPGDRKLAQSAQMYHYQHQKQQMIAMEKANGEMKQDASEDESEEENEEGDYTVYECPGLAPTGEMEVRNPLFTEETTPVNGQPPKVNGLDDNTAE